MSDEVQDMLRASLAHAWSAHAAGDSVAARRAFHQAHLLSPDSPEILLDLATACLSCDDPAQALVHAKKAQMRTDGWHLNIVLTDIYQRTQTLDAAHVHFQKAIEEPAMPAALRVSALQKLADLQLNAFGDPHSAALSLQKAASTSPALSLEATLATLVADLYQGNRSGAEIAAGFATLAQQLQPDSTAPTHVRLTKLRQRPRIGLISQQFCASPVGFLTLGAVTALAQHADLVFFDRGAKVDWAQAAFKAKARHWLACGMLNAVQLYKLLIEADLDAVIDLSGWTDPQALRAFARRPVRRQLKWVGGQSLSTGMPCFDGFVTDKRQVPGAAAKHYTEPMLYAEHGYVTYTAPPYAPELTVAASKPPRAPAKVQAGVVALVSNPAKISHHTAEALQQLKPKKLVLVDQRWRHEGTRLAAQNRLGSLMDVAEFITPANHPEYLQTLGSLDATFLDTAPYAMGLSAIELRLLGKHIVTGPRSASAVMCERHCVAHMGAKRFDHHNELARQLLAWCQA